jgi:pimeloyl-ACP methyl ester carboxylesterase
MHVEAWEPDEVRRSWPLVLIHGGGGQGLDWLGPADGRPGWVEYLLEEGYRVFVVDRPGHGRASLHPEVLGPVSAPFTYERAISLFMGAPQWPGTGRLGNPVLDQFLASAGPSIADFRRAHELEQRRGAELLDRIGPAVLMTHSAGGPSGWLIADTRPQLVKAIVAIEPLGPPFAEQPERGLKLEWGLAQAPLDWANLHGIPIALVTAEASWFAQQDVQTVAFLRKVGCDVDHVRLQDHGVHGNGHLLMLEANNREALQPILDWLERL